MKYYGLHGALQAKSGQGQALADILLKAAELLEKEEGCHLYMISQDVQNVEKIWITEAWQDETTHDNSLKNPEIRALIGQAMPMLAGSPEVGQKLTILGGLGI